MIRNSLRTRLTLIFIALAVLPILLLGIVFSWLSFISLPIQALDLQKEIAQGLGARVHKLVEDRQQELYFLTNIRSIQRLDRDQQVSLLSALLIDQNAYDELTLIDAQGQEQIRLAREIFITPDELTNRLGKVEFQHPKRSGKVYFGPIQVDPETGEPFMSMAIPLIRPQDETFLGVLAATIRFKPVWDLLVSEQDDSNRTVYIVDKTNRVVAHADKTLVLGETFVDLEVKEGATLGLDGVSDVVRATYPIHLGEQRLFVVAERPVSEALALTISTLYITGGATLIALIFAIGPSILIVYRIMWPINQLSLTAQAISVGDLSQQVTVNSQDEVGILAAAFNKMTEQLKTSIGGLEQRVSERTRGLEISATLSESLTAILDVEQLLSELVTQVKDNFGYYHVQVYLLDEQKLQLNMVSGSGEAGKQMKLREHAIPLNAPTSLVARAARQANVVMVNNVREEPGWLFNPLLSETASEMAVPIILNKDVVGVLDVQENKIAGLDDGDASILRPLANQVAVAIRNARLFSDVQKALTEARRIQSQYVQRAWLTNQTVQHHAYYQRPEALTLGENTHIFLDRLARTQYQPQTLSSGGPQSMSMDSDDDTDIEKDKDLKTDLENDDLPYTALIAPIKLQNQIIGSMQFYETDLSRRHTWTDQEIAFMQTIADQIAQTAENLRLFEETRHRADYERLVSEITQKIRQAPNLEALTKTAAKTLSQVLGVSDSVVRLNTKIEPDLTNGHTHQEDTDCE